VSETTIANDYHVVAVLLVEPFGFSLDGEDAFAGAKKQ
jgi:hypothetical protein